MLRWDSITAHCHIFDHLSISLIVHTHLDIAPKAALPAHTTIPRPLPVNSQPFKGYLRHGPDLFKPDLRASPLSLPSYWGGLSVSLFSPSLPGSLMVWYTRICCGEQEHRLVVTVGIQAASLEGENNPQSLITYT